MTALPTESLLMNKCIIKYGTPTHSLTDNQMQFIRKVFEAPWAYLETAHVTTTAPSLQTNEQSERLNMTIVARLRQCLAEHQQDCDIHLKLST